MNTENSNTKTIIKCHEVQIHYKRPFFNIIKKVSSSEDSEKLLRSFIDIERIDYKEFFWVLLLTNANQVIGVSEIAVGNTSGVMVNIKEIYQLALLANASAIIVAHNHPSGKLTPSEADKRLTQKLSNASKLLDITLLDHLILTSEGFVSFSDSNWM
ncbi:JAB domain-containing protein [Olleya sp. UBA1516]|uniref:JAB domain-containing protein n=1 Tax=Olleya sp. UBA1516 TaxID=1947013 RepID=UPI0025F3D244|nr:JAB domain-containing protein [Olleya sp. UBA1516]|tara:strand:+ start:7431 stop:7901 length:471 start_codon:yes stop_codon:yes gene_type:complete